ncbi:MAG: signal peptidase II [Nitrospinae bacterium]|nr:signal peptidase II [Nitrospinota bacterium]MZH41146.1 signal peptidase II [Nitrospinota bacterium]MZH45724.1 signal peptidase II [Nitrospinota bacterium]
MRNKYLSLLIVSGVLIVIDQYTKLMVSLHIPLNYSVEVIEGIFNLTHIRNSGVAFGLFASQQSEYKALMFITISTIAITAILVIFHQTPKEKKMVQIGLILIFSGAIGNLIDRSLHGEVIDFVDLFINGHHFPAFNIADSCITMGVALMVIDLFSEGSRPDPSTNTL